jgi:hypothetical protein
MARTVSAEPHRSHDARGIAGRHGAASKARLLGPKIKAAAAALPALRAMLKQEEEAAACFVGWGAA